MWIAIRRGGKYHWPKHGHKFAQAVCGVRLKGYELVSSDDPLPFKICKNCSYILSVAEKHSAL